MLGTLRGGAGGGGGQTQNKHTWYGCPRLGAVPSPEPQAISAPTSRAELGSTLGGPSLPPSHPPVQSEVLPAASGLSWSLWTFHDLLFLFLQMSVLWPTV